MAADEQWNAEAALSAFQPFRPPSTGIRHRTAVPYFPPCANARAVSSCVLMPSCFCTISLPGGAPLRILASSSPARLRRSRMASRALAHDASEPLQADSAVEMFDSTPSLNDPHAARSYGGLAKRPMPEPQRSEEP